MLAAVCYQQGKLPEAEQSYREAWVAYTKCNAVASADFTEVVRSLAEVLIGQQKLAEAESVLNEALAQEQQILGERNTRTAAVLIALARCLELESRPDQAAHRRIEAADILTNSPPEDLIHLPPELIPELIEAGLEQVARDECNRASALTPVNASWLDGASWALVLSERPPGRNAALAVELAQKAAETRPESRSYENPLGAEPRITALQWRDLRQFQRVIFLPESRSYQNSLGAALYRAREWPRAVMELEQAAARSQETKLRCDLFLLAMAHQRVGEAELARRYYSEAVSWMADHCPAEKKLVRLRAETEALLGVNTSSQRSQ